jgi:hypothetical protein
MVMSWRTTRAGLLAALIHHNVVMSPQGNAYLDLYQGDTSAEPPTYAMCRLTNAYNWDPAPDSSLAKYILGGQGIYGPKMFPTSGTSNTCFIRAYWHSQKCTGRLLLKRTGLILSGELRPIFQLSTASISNIPAACIMGCDR